MSEAEESPPSAESRPLIEPIPQGQGQRQEGNTKARVVLLASLLALLVLVSVIIAACLFPKLQSKTEQRKIFSQHTQRIYEEDALLQKKEVCVDPNPGYDKNYTLFHSACDNEELHVINSLVAITHVTSADLNYYFQFGPRSFINVTAVGGHTYYRWSPNADIANKFDETTCNGLEILEHGFVNMTDNTLQIFKEKGYYHICFDRDDTNTGIRPSFKMSITEFYNDIPEQERVNCIYTNEQKREEKCCHSPARATFCVYFFSGSSTVDPVTKLNPLTVRISYDDKLQVVPYVFVAIAILAVLTICAIGITAYYKRQRNQGNTTIQDG